MHAYHFPLHRAFCQLLGLNKLLGPYKTYVNACSTQLIPVMCFNLQTN